MVLNMLNKLLAIILSISFVFSSTYAYSEQLETTTSSIGQFSILKKGDIAKFDGILLDPLAMATAIADKEQKEKEFNLKLDFELKKQQSDYSLQIQNLKLSLDYEKKVNLDIINSKDKELKQLRESALSKSDNSVLYLSASFVGGIIATILVIFAYNKVSH